MYPTLAQEILYAHGIAYALTDARLEIVHHSDNLKHHDHETLLGLSLLTIAPEMRDKQDIYDALLDGKMDRWDLPCVMRVDGDGTARLFYLRLTRFQVEPPPHGFLYIQHDLTLVGLGQVLLGDPSDELSVFRKKAALDLRAGLTPLHGYLEMLADGEFGKLSSAQIQVITTLQQGVRRLADLGETWLTPPASPDVSL
jgi:hypothetical protein